MATAYRSGDNALGKAAKDASKALEDQLEANLSGDALKNFRDARTLIAKTHTVGKALNDTTGAINPQNLAAQLKAGKPLTGELETIARAAQLPGRSMQYMQYATPAASQLEGAASTAAAVGMGNPAPLAVPFARGGLRSAMLSDAFQSMIPKRSYGLLSTMTPAEIGKAQKFLTRSGAVAGLAAPSLLHLGD